LQGNRARPYTAIQVSATPSLGIMGRTTMLPQLRSPMDGQANFYISNCGDFVSSQPKPVTQIFCASSCDTPTGLSRTYRHPSLQPARQIGQRIAHDEIDQRHHSVDDEWLE